MRRMIRKLGGMFVPIIFCTALIFTASMSLDLTDEMCIRDRPYGIHYLEQHGIAEAELRNSAPIRLLIAGE